MSADSIIDQAVNVSALITSAHPLIVLFISTLALIALRAPRVHSDSQDFEE